MSIYLRMFYDALERGASDEELQDIIDTASIMISDNAEYMRFYELAMYQYKQYEKRIVFC